MLYYYIVFRLCCTDMLSKYDKLSNCIGQEENTFNKLVSKHNLYFHNQFSNICCYMVTKTCACQIIEMVSFFPGIDSSARPQGVFGCWGRPCRGCWETEAGAWEEWSPGYRKKEKWVIVCVLVFRRSFRHLRLERIIISHGIDCTQSRFTNHNAGK